MKRISIHLIVFLTSFLLFSSDLYAMSIDEKILVTAFNHILYIFPFCFFIPVLEYAFVIVNMPLKTTGHITSYFILAAVNFITALLAMIIHYLLIVPMVMAFRRDAGNIDDYIISFNISFVMTSVLISLAVKYIFQKYLLNDWKDEKIRIKTVIKLVFISHVVVGFLYMRILLP